MVLVLAVIPGREILIKILIQDHLLRRNANDHIYNKVPSQYNAFGGVEVGARALRPGTRYLRYSRATDQFFAAPSSEPPPWKSFWSRRRIAQRVL